MPGVGMKAGSTVHLSGQNTNGVGTASAPLVSVVIIAYNSARFLSETLAMLLPEIIPKSKSL